MPRKYLCKTQRVVDEGQMAEALDAVINKKISIRETVIAYPGVKRSTLNDYVQRAKKGENFHLGTFNQRRVFTSEQEGTLAEYLLTCSSMYYGLTPHATRRLAYEYVQANGIVYPQMWDENCMAGKDWLTSFIKRNQQISIRSPEGTSLARMTAFNKTNVELFYNNLRDVMERFKLTPSRIFNLDETGCTTVQKLPKILALKGSHQVGQATSRERGELVTAVGIICANGNALPLTFVFPRVRFNEVLMLRGTPVGTVGLVHLSGWMTSANFQSLLVNFCTITKPTKDEPLLLIMDNHDSHLSVEGLDYAKEHGIVILTLTPHTSNKLQPLDVGVYGPFKSYYNKGICDWMVNHPGQTIGIYDIPAIACKAWDNSATPKNIKSSFEATGIVPLNRDRFTAEDFAMSAVTDRECPSMSSQAESTDLVTPLTTTVTETAGDQPSTSSCAIEASCTPRPPDDTSMQTPTKTTTPSKTLSPADIRPLPKAPPRKEGTKGRKRGKCCIATDTPEKKRIQEEKSKVKPKIAKKPKSVRTLVAKKLKAKIIKLSSSSSNSSMLDDIEKLMDDNSDCSEFDPVDTAFDISVVEPKVDNYVLIEFENKTYYTVKISKPKDEEGDYEISYLRKSNKVKNAFVFPLAEDIASVASSQIKAILPPMSATKSKRLNSFIRFSVLFTGLNIR